MENFLKFVFISSYLVQNQLQIKKGVSWTRVTKSCWLRLVFLHYSSNAATEIDVYMMKIKMKIKKKLRYVLSGILIKKIWLPILKTNVYFREFLIFWDSILLLLLIHPFPEADLGG